MADYTKSVSTPKGSVTVTSKGGKISVSSPTSSAPSTSTSSTSTSSGIKRSGSGGGSNDIVKYDAKTGQLLAKGATTTDAMGNTFKQGTSFGAQPKIYAGDLGKASPMNLPQPPQTPNYNGTVIGASQANQDPPFGVSADPQTGLYSITPPSDENGTLNAPTQTSLDSLKALMGLVPKQENVAKQIEESQAMAERNAAREAVNKYANQINSIVTKSQADQLSVIGQGRGIPEVIIGGQQAQIAREAAIQSLPIQALMANAQGNLEIAQQHLDSWSNILREEAKNNYEYKSNMFNLVKEFSDKHEQREFDALQKQEDRKYNEQQKLIDTRSQLMSLALRNQAPDSVFNAIRSADSVDGAVMAAGNYGFQRNTQIVEETGYDGITRKFLINTDTGEKIASYDSELGTRGGTGGGGGTGLGGVVSPEVDQWAQLVNDGTYAASDIPKELRSAVAQRVNQLKAESKIRDADAGIAITTSLLNDPHLGDVTGVTKGLFVVPGTEAAATKNQFKQLRSVLTLNNRQKLKGQGTITDRESDMLGEASTALNSNLSAEDARTQIRIIEDIFKESKRREMERAGLVYNENAVLKIGDGGTLSGGITYTIIE